ncbi:hypothetical protein SLPG_00032 [Salicola phage CGphi29]|uniref:hypothetical protein n=1 Tax=Salicola phage CGphi29 TaxID=754067 RepID=UPI0002C10448|nr:hypothetical protein SLPG_00032 [Salicola phage CGphi29]AGH31826.1 hypothetical protein SLPG_00032 [Salicola phage CGphi29]
MATIASTKVQGSGEIAVTKTTLTASDTFDFNSGQELLLVIDNGSGSPVTPNIVGDEATTVTVSGIGEIDVSTGYDFDEIADGEAVVLNVSTVNKYLSGTIDLTGADGADAYILEL